MMEFHEKLQQLRKQHNFTQEQLAERLFVSRTAVSKWESGRGYPNLESLKYLSKLFGISIDELLSNDELLELAECDKCANIGRIIGLVFGALDVIALALLFLPLFGQQEGDYVRAVTLLNHTGMGEVLRWLYVGALLFLSAFGVFELAAELINPERWLSLCRLCSLALHAAAVFLFAVSRQPYVTALLFLLFVVKGLLLIQETRMK